MGEVVQDVSLRGELPMTTQGLTYADVEQILRTFTYKPDISFELRPKDDGQHPGIEWSGIGWIVITMYVPDSTARHRSMDFTYHDYHEVYSHDSRLPRRTYPAGRASVTHEVIPITGRFMIPNHLSPLTFKLWLRATVGDLEGHETDEWFKFDGVPMHNPHDA